MSLRIQMIINGKTNFYHDNSWRVWHGNVKENVHVFDLGRTNLLLQSLATATDAALIT